MTSTTIAKTTPVAMLAVASHMIDRHLPAPQPFLAPLACRDEQAVIVYLLSDDVTAWTDSIHVDHVDTVPGYWPQYERDTTHGRLPDTGVRVELRTVRRLHPLAVVPALVTLVCDLCHEDDVQVTEAVVSDADTLDAEHGWTTTVYGTHRHIRCDQIENGVDL